MSGFVGETAKVNIAGAGRAKVHATQDLAVDIGGSNNSTSDIARQILHGISGADFAALTATATEEVRRDVVKQLSLRDQLWLRGIRYHHGEGSVGLGKPLKIMTHPLRADLPGFDHPPHYAEVPDGAGDQPVR